MGRARRAALWWSSIASRRQCIAVALAVVLLIAPPLAATPQWLPLAQITSGMTGVGKTVVQGTRVSEFSVRVLGVLRNAGPAGDLVLFRASGPAIQSVGGLAAGMSGSPIYIGGRMAGAFSYSLQFADPAIGLFTPIEDMLKDVPTRAVTSPASAHAVLPFLLGGRTIRRILLNAAPIEAPLPADTVAAFPAVTPLFVAGLGESQVEEMAHAFLPMGLAPMAGPGAAPLPSTIPLEPGSAIGVGLMRGDISAVALGTLSYRDGDRILAFGHSFTNLGKTEFLLTNATIFETVRGVNHNLKIGAAGAPVGTIFEDRPAAVGGTIGTLPRLFGVKVTVADEDTGVGRQFRFQVAAHKDLAPILVALGTQGAVERALNRSGEGTARVHMILRGRMLPKQVERENIFYSGSEIATRALGEVPEALHLLFDNDFSDVGPSDLEIAVRITKVRQTGTITEVTTPKTPAVAGQPFRVHVTVRPFREAAAMQDIDLHLPADFPEGIAVLTVRGGGAASPAADVPEPAGVGPGASAIRNLGDAISTFEGGEKNTDVVVELTSSLPRLQASDSAAGPARTSTRWATPWVLGGRLQMPITVRRGAR
jgi:hypothetical protein